jgi:hypothetical protein
MAVVRLGDLVDRDTYEIIEVAEAWSCDLLGRARAVLSSLLGEKGIDPSNIGFVAVGSVGRHEALNASDLDLIPVVRNARTLRDYRRHDKAIRSSLAQQLRIKVSKGEDLTKFVDLGTLVAPDTIGGDKDSSSALTRRILILSEGQQAGGGLPADEIRAAVLNAYAGADRTRGRHVLSLCNDLARYYRTLCIEYKAKIDVEEKDWATRNMKLRHSRKFWYVSSMLAIASLARNYPGGEEDYVANLCAAFADAPIRRLANAVGEGHGALLSQILGPFAYFLSFMGDRENRELLAKVRHDERDRVEVFRQLKRNSDRMHEGIVQLIKDLDAAVHKRVVDWFLL